MIDVSPAAITLPSDTEILVTSRLVAAPALVYRAWTEPELVAKWWAGQRGEMRSVEIDLRVGGMWRYVMVASGGFEVAFHGTYREVVDGERLVSSDVFEMPGAAALPAELEPVSTTTFAADGAGGTVLRILTRTANREMRDMIAGSGMEGGVQEQMVALEAVAGGLAAG